MRNFSKLIAWDKVSKIGKELKADPDMPSEAMLPKYVFTKTMQ